MNKSTHSTQFHKSQQVLSVLYPPFVSPPIVVTINTIQQCVAPVTSNDRFGDNVRPIVDATTLPPTPPTPTLPSGQAVINGLAAVAIAAATPPAASSLSANVGAIHSSVGATSGCPPGQTSNRLGVSGVSVSATVGAMLSISAPQQQQQIPAVVVVANTTTSTSTPPSTGDNKCDDKMKSDRTVSATAAAPSESEMIKRDGSCGGSGSKQPPQPPQRISVATTTSVQTKAATTNADDGGGQLVAASGAVVSADVRPLRGSRSDKPSDVDGVEQLIRRLQIAEEEVFDDINDDPYAELEYYLENVKVSDCVGIVFFLFVENSN